MRSSSPNDAVGVQARSVEDAGILSAAAGILGVAPDARYFEMLVRRAVEDMGADYAWVQLKGEGGGLELIASASCRAGLRADPAGAADTLQARLADGVSFECLDGFPCEDPWFGQAGVQACVARTVYDMNAVACGHIAFAFKRSLASASAYAASLSMLAAFAQHAVLGTAARERELARLREAAAQYDALFQAAPVLINAFGPDGKCILWNEACERRFGWSASEIKACDDPLALFYSDPRIKELVIDSVGPQPSRMFREWHPRTRSGELLTVLWANIRLPNGNVVNIGLDVTESRRAEAALERMACLDSLTGCWNRAEILKRMTERLAGIRRGAGGPATALMLDLDYFKMVNDRHGHLGGDAALRHFCDLLRACVRDGDSVGRLGGEEFLVVLANADEGVAQAIYSRLQTSLRQHPVSIDGEDVTLSVSGGIALFAESDTNASDVLRRADQALYQAKRAGRGCAVQYRWA